MEMQPEELEAYSCFPNFVQPVNFNEELETYSCFPIFIYMLILALFAASVLPGLFNSL